LRGKREGKHGPPARLIARGNPAVVVLNDALADGQPQSRPVRLSVSGECLEQFSGDLGGDSRASVLDFGDHLLRAGGKAQHDRAPVGHRVCRVSDQVIKNPAQPFGIEQQLD